MDVYKKTISRKKVIASVLFVIAILYVYFRVFISSSDELYDIPANEMITGVVQRGDLEVRLDAYGILKSNSRRLLTSHSDAVVEEIILKPGSLVSIGSTILKLQSPELKETQQRLHQHYLSSIANKRHLKLEQEQELLEENLNLVKLTSKQKTVEFNSLEVDKLAEKGIISKFKHLEMVAEREEIKTLIQISKLKLNKMKASHEEAMEIEDVKIAQAKADLVAIEDKIDRLTVTVDSSGIVQELYVDLGQSVKVGDKLATVSKSDDLIASLSISQTQAVNLNLGLQAEIDVGGQIIRGEIVRIDPAVKNGTITVEVEFSSQLPSAARPSLAIEGQIIALQVKDTLFVSRPLNSNPNSKNFIFKVNKDNSISRPEEVEFGAANNTYIEIIKGLEQGDKVIISNTHKLQEMY
ncbi:efflux RND transporter periplasmic adaptor subunit [Microbulbifer sp. ZKSA004]|uniref:efflux RND transporter periplasmic adaptor subunit n=1 Tax=Microbulbifer sp. ZKSA004 TaxID=3243389 RepID=UPI00403A447D